MDAEQTWPTEEEMKEVANKAKNKRMIKRVPEGMSVYQSAWIPDEESDHGNYNLNALSKILLSCMMFKIYIF